MKTIRLFFYLILFLTFTSLLNSCKDDPVSNAVNPNVVTSLNGIVKSLPSNARIINGFVVKDTVNFVAAGDTVGSDNIMNLNLSIPPQSAVYILRDIIAQLGGGISYTDPDAKGNFINFLVFNSITGQLTGSVVKTNNPNNIQEEGDFFIIYLYSDREVNISRNSTEISNNDTVIYRFSLNLGTGYNRIIKGIKTLRPNFTEFEVFSGEPGSSDWYYFPDISNTFDNRKSQLPNF